MGDEEVDSAINDTNTRGRLCCRRAGRSLGRRMAVSGGNGMRIVQRGERADGCSKRQHAVNVFVSGHRLGAGARVWESAGAGLWSGQAGGRGRRCKVAGQLRRQPRPWRS